VKTIIYRSLSQYRANALKLRRSHTLHSNVRQRFIWLLRQVDKKAIATPESSTLSLGHRVDLKSHLGDGRTLQAEIFASAEMVSRDINSLVNSIADIRLAILLDDIIDKSVADTYFHELKSRNLPPDFFPVIKLSNLMISSQSTELKRCLRELLGFGEFARSGHIPLNYLRQPATEWYISKSGERSAIDEFIQSFRSRDPLNLFVTGSRGIGKSSFLNALEQSLNIHNISFVKRTVDTEDWRELLRELNGDTKSLLDSKGFKTVEVGTSTSIPEVFARVAIDAATKLPNGMVYIVDQFERLFERGIEEATQLEVERVWRSYSDLTASLRSKVRISWVLAAREQYYFMIFPRMGCLHDYDFSYFYVHPFQTDEAIKLVNRVSSLTGFHLTEDATRMLAERCFNHPQNILLSFINIFADGDKQGPVDEIELERRQPWIEVFEADLQRTNTKLERLILYAMAQSLQEITSFEDIRSRVSSQIEIDESELRNALRGLQDKLSLIKQPRHDIFEFFHARFADYIREKHGHEFPPEWSVRRLIETALTLVKEAGGGWVAYSTAKNYLHKALGHSISNYHAYFKATEILEGAEEYEATVDLMIDFREALKGIRYTRINQLSSKVGWEKAQEIVNADIELNRINDEILEKLETLTDAIVHCEMATVDRIQLLCQVANELRADRQTFARTLIKLVADSVMEWQERLPETGRRPVLYFLREGDILQSFGHEEAALIIFQLNCRSRNYDRWHRVELRKAVSLLRKRGKHQEALELLEEAFDKASGKAVKADHLFDAATLAYELNKNKAVELYTKLAPLAEYLERTSRTDGAKRKWGEILGIAKSRGKYIPKKHI
jgi:tetratricopeptide (TPR) repeat protein